MNNEINLPVTKAVTAITATALAKADVADQVARAVTTTSDYETWVFINSIPWGTISLILASTYTGLLLSEWWWKKLWRPVFEYWGLVKPIRRRVITVEEYNAGETDRAPL